MDYTVVIPLIGISIPFVAIVSTTANRYFRLREKQIELAADQAAEKAARYAANGAEMEQRVRALERIVTDRGIDIAHEIDRLAMAGPEKMRSH